MRTVHAWWTEAKETPTEQQQRELIEELLHITGVEPKPYSNADPV